jgi:hypothetical protein
MNCENKAAFRYTWPGKDESFVCSAHAMKLKWITDALQTHLQLVPVAKGQHDCKQQVEGIKCQRCDGCGLLADDDEKSPWKYWEELEPPANIAVTMGMVKPVICEKCEGECYV